MEKNQKEKKPKGSDWKNKGMNVKSGEEKEKGKKLGVKEKREIKSRRETKRERIREKWNEVRGKEERRIFNI